MSRWPPPAQPFGLFGADSPVRLLIPLLPPGLARVQEVGRHLSVPRSTIALSLVAAFPVCMDPAWQVSASRQRGPASHSRLRDLLIGAEDG